MKEHYSSKYDKNIATIYPGELYATADDKLIATLLGSCIAVCLYDSEKGIAGMNHFMLEGKILSKNISTTSTDKHAYNAIMSLLKLMKELGASKKILKAKIFGGGAVLKSEQSFHNVPANNIKAAKLVLEMEDIPIEQEDTGGKFTRKVLLDTKSGKVYLRKTLPSEIPTSIE